MPSEVHPHSWTNNPIMGVHFTIFCGAFLFIISQFQLGHQIGICYLSGSDHSLPFNMKVQDHYQG